MSAEHVAEMLAEAAAEWASHVDGEATEDVRSGGFFFELKFSARHYEVLVVEVGVTE